MARFVDTNVLLYSISTDSAEQTKAAVADQVLLSGDIVLSTQVLGEFYVQATRAGRPSPLAHEDAVWLIRDFAIHPVQAVTLSIVEAALATRARFQLSYWDAAIIEAARAAGCREVLSEDMSDRQDYDGVRVVNPFLW